MTDFIRPRLKVSQLEQLTSGLDAVLTHADLRDWLTSEERIAFVDCYEQFQLALATRKAREEVKRVIDRRI
jgi:hypothetical protein